MTAPSPSLFLAGWRKLRGGIKQALLVGHRQGRRLGHFAKTKAWPWCADHVLSLALLSAIPLGIGTYYWGAMSAAGSASHDVMRFDPDQTAEVESVPQTDRTAYEPIQPPQQEWPPGETFSTSVKNPGGLMEPWSFPAAPAKSDESSVQNCVWLTGTIEEPSVREPHRLQHASQEQEWIRPARR